MWLQTILHSRSVGCGDGEETPDNQCTTLALGGSNGTNLVTIGTQTLESNESLQNVVLEVDSQQHINNQNLAALYHGGWPIGKGMTPIPPPPPTQKQKIF